MDRSVTKVEEKVRRVALGGPCRRPLRKRVTYDEERTRKNRKLINHHLQRVGSPIGKNLSLSAAGVCYFPFQKFIIVVEVPEDNPNVCFLYTCVSQLGKSDNQMEVVKLAMKLNYMQYGTRGATLGLDGEEVNLCFSTAISTLSNYCDLKAVLEDFMQTAMEMNKKLEAAKRAPHALSRHSSRSTSST